MTTAIVVLIIVFVFYAIISLIFIGGWHSFRDSNILGGLLLLWIFLILFAIAVIFSSLQRG
jgi:hypothetical protein